MWLRNFLGTSSQGAGGFQGDLQEHFMRGDFKRTYEWEVQRRNSRCISEHWFLLQNTFKVISNVPSYSTKWKNIRSNSWGLMSGQFYSILLVTGWQGPEHRLAVKSQYFVLIWHLCSLYCLRGWAGDHWPVLPPAPHCPSQWPQMRWSPLTHQHDGHPLLPHFIMI